MHHRNTINSFFSFTDSLFQNLCKVAQEIYCFGFLNTNLSRLYNLQCSPKLESILKVLLDSQMKSRKHSPKDSGISIGFPLCLEPFMKLAFLRDSRGNAEVAQRIRKDNQEKTRKEDREGSHGAKQEW